MLTTATLSAIPTASAPARRPRWEVLAIVLVVAVALAPFLIQHALWLWQRPHYQFFPAVILGAAVLAYSRIRTNAVQPGAPGPAALGLSAGWAVLAAAVLLESGWLACIAAMELFLALAYAAGGRALCRQLLTAWVLLGFLVPPPLDLDRALVFKLQNVTTAWSSAILDLLGVFHLRSGNIIEVDGKRLLIEQACSGVNSLFALLACTVFLVFLTRRGPAAGCFLITAAVGWVLVVNVARVTGVVLLDTRWGMDVATGWRHELFGLAWFAVAVGLLLSTDQFVKFLTRSPRAADDANCVEGGRRVDGTKTADQSPPLSSAPIPAPPSVTVAASQTALRRLALGAVPAFMLLAVPAWRALQPDLDIDLAAAQATVPDAEFLPKTTGVWERQQFEVQTREAHSFFGERSSIWKYGSPRQSVILSLDTPFFAWHDLTWCYTARGWHIDSQTVRTDLGVEGGCVEVRLSLPGRRHGYLLFAEFNDRGQPLAARPGGMEASFSRHQKSIQKLRSWLGLEPPPAADPGGAIFQFQMFWDGYDRLSAEDEAAAAELFARSASLVRESCARKETGFARCEPQIRYIR